MHGCTVLYVDAYFGFWIARILIYINARALPFF